jgi:hypothetical protein
LDAAICDPTAVAGDPPAVMHYALVSVLTDNDPTDPNAGYDRWETTDDVDWEHHSNAIAN